MIISKTHFFLLLSQSGTNLTLTSETQQASILLKRCFLLHTTLCHLSHLHEHKFRHCFQDTLNPLCECGKDIESRMHFFLHCTNSLIPKQSLFQKIMNIDDNILPQSETQLTQTLLYRNQNYHSSINKLIIISTSINKLIIISTIKYVMSTERFKCSLIN